MEVSFFNNLLFQIVMIIYYYYQEFVTVPLDNGATTQDRKIIRREVIGRDVFRYLFEDVSLQDGNVSGYREHLNYFGLSKYDITSIPSYFDHYFRHLYKIVQFVDSQEFSFEEKYRYLSFLRGTLSRYELVWLYYNALIPAFYKFKSLIEKYSLLKSLRVELLTMTKEAKQYYDGLGITSDEADGDYSFYLTDDSSEKSKYLLSAFYNDDNRQEGISTLARFRELIENKEAEQRKRKQTTAPPSSFIGS